MTLLQDITTAALLGTERQAFAPAPNSGPLGDLLARLPADPEAALRGAAALASLYQRAGVLPSATDVPRPEPCPPDDQPVCSGHVTQGLAVMLGGAHREALPEMLAALASVGRRVPETLLPELLKAGRQDRSLRGALLSVLGRRGQWLAAQNRDWAYADQLLLEMAESLEQVWAEGNREARLSALTSLRETDPAAGLALLQDTWAVENTGARTEFVATLCTGLNADDEPFLEAALDDRSRDVRRTAADLLARLPGSQYSRRMVARADALLSGKRSLLGGFSLDVTPPAGLDKDMERDGIQSGSTIRNLGDKAWWLSRIIAAVPLGHWTDVWRRKPVEIVEATARTMWSEALLLGWQSALVKYPSDEWAEALTQHYLSRKLALPSDLSLSWSHLSREALEALALKALRSSPYPLHDAHPAATFLSSISGPWSQPLSLAVIGSIRDRVAVRDMKEQSAYGLGQQLRHFALVIPPTLINDFSQDWPEQSPQWAYWQPHVHEFLTTLQFRYDLLNAISQEARP